MNLKRIGFLGIAAWVLSWSASLVLGAMRPSYSHVANTLSELGAVGTPNAILWNLFGFMIPGVLLAIVGAAIAYSVAEPSIRRLFAMALLGLAGLAVSAQGILPAEMVNGVADIQSAATRAHFVASIASGAAWVVGALLLVGPMKRSPDWQGLYLVSIARLGFPEVSASIGESHTV